MIDSKNILSFVTVVYNEEDTLETLLKQARLYAGELIVLDCSSTDDTHKIAERFADKVILRDFTGSSGKGGHKQCAIDLVSKEWIMILDGDELLDDELCRSIINGNLFESGKNGWWLRRKWIIRNKTWQGFLGDDRQLRLFKKESSCWLDGVHMFAQVSGNTDHFPVGWILHRVKDNRFFERYEKYTELEPWNKEFNEKVINNVRRFVDDSSTL